MPYVKLRARLGADEIRAVMVDKPRRWNWRKCCVNLLMMAGVLVMLWLAATDLIPEAVDHELNRMPTAESVVMDGGMVVEDEPQTLTMTATAYSWGCGNGDGLTASMTPVRPGVVAIDPEVIPLGSQVEIVGLGMFSAEDVGGNIRGNRVDIFMPSRGVALQFGRQEVEVRVFE